PLTVDDVATRRRPGHFGRGLKNLRKSGTGSSVKPSRSGRDGDSREIPLLDTSARAAMSEWKAERVGWPGAADPTLLLEPPRRAAVGLEVGRGRPAYGRNGPRG